MKVSFSFVMIAGATTLLFVLAYFAGSLGRLLSTIVTTIIAILVVAGVWLVSNLILNQARNRWAVFTGVSAALIAAIAFAMMRGNQTIRALTATADPIQFGAGAGLWGHIEWPIIGGVIWGGGAALIASLEQRAPRLGIGVAMGAVTAWLIGSYTQVWQLPQISWGALILWLVIGTAVGAGLSIRSGSDPVPGALVGAAVASLINLWLRAPFGGSETDGIVATAIPLVLIGLRMAWKGAPNPAQVSRLEERGRAAIFLGPAVLFLSAALVVPAIGTIRLSFLNRDSTRSVGLRNYRNLFGDPDSFDVSNWRNLFSSQLFWIAIVLAAAGLLIGTFVGTTRNGTASFERNGASTGPIAIGVFVLLTAVFSVLRGTFFNNLWWIVTVTVMSVVLGLTIAVLAERAGKYESVAKSLIFMPMAVSFVGASIVWRLQYQARPISKSQTGVLNYTWIELGKLSHSGWPRWLALALLLALLVRLGMAVYDRLQADSGIAAPAIGLVVFGYLFYQLLRRSLGGFTIGADGEVGPEFVLFLQNPPFNNIFLMIVLIWIQTGFAMVILSAAIKAVPTEFIEAARVDGATDSQIFFNITFPSILPTVGVITTTLIVLVAKVFDIVNVTTGGLFGTNVFANDFFRELTQDKGLSTTIATLILVSVLPVMVLNVRRMQQARNS